MGVEEEVDVGVEKEVDVGVEEEEDVGVGVAEVEVLCVDNEDILIPEATPMFCHMQL